MVAAVVELQVELDISEFDPADRNGRSVLGRAERNGGNRTVRRDGRLVAGGRLEAEALREAEGRNHRCPVRLQDDGVAGVRVRHAFGQGAAMRIDARRGRRVARKNDRGDDQRECDEQRPHGP